MGILYIVATPIGNLEDLTHRAERVLNEVDLVACEDTRHTRKLLDRYQIKTKTVSYHQYSKITKIDFLIKELKSDRDIALVSDAGTPGISDPGGVLVSEAIKHKIKVVPIPGASALSSIISISGFSTDSVLFLGFLPKKKGRQTLMRNLMKSGGLGLYQAVVFYESPYRIVDTLKDLQLAVGNHQLVIGRELTKQFEEIFRGSVVEAIQYFSLINNKGEFTIIIKTNNKV